MRVPLTVSDFIDRAEFVYPDRPAVVDEPAPVGRHRFETRAAYRRRRRGWLRNREATPGHSTVIAPIPPEIAAQKPDKSGTEAREMAEILGFPGRAQFW